MAETISNFKQATSIHMSANLVVDVFHGYAPAAAADKKLQFPNVKRSTQDPSSHARIPRT